MIQMTVNGKASSSAAPGDKPLLWVLREDLALTGTKFGCGVAQCGACTVHIDGAPARACVTPASVAAGKRITTIEGLAQTREGKALREAWIAEQAPQCGYCQSGQIMAAAAVIKQAQGPLTHQQVLDQMHADEATAAGDQQHTRMMSVT